MPSTLTKSSSSAKRGGRPAANVFPAIALCTALVVAIFMVYGQTFSFPFLKYDDVAFVSEQPHVTGGLTLSGIRWAFSEGTYGEWYPLSSLSYMLDCQLFGLDPAAHHRTNVLLHAATAVGLLLVLWRMTGQRAVPEVAQASGGRVAPAGPSATTSQRAVPEAAQASGGRVAPAGPSATTLWPSAMVAALFALHPLRVESVAWIAERRDVLSGLLLVLTLAAYDGYVRRPKSWLRYAAVVLLFALGLMAKAMLVTVPALLLVLDYWPLARFGGAAETMPDALAPPAGFNWRIVLEKLPLLALSAAAALLTLLTHSSRGNPLPLSERLANAAISCVAYLAQFFCPVGLSVFYSYPAAGWPAWQVAAAILVLLSISAAAVIWRRSLPYLFVGWFWFLGMLAPVSGLTYVGSAARADRYTYLPEIGLAIALVWGAMRITAHWPGRRWLLAIGSAAILAALAASAWRQTGYWRDDLGLWRHAVACDPSNVTAHSFWGGALWDVDQGAAAEQYRLTLEMNEKERGLYPTIWVTAHNRLGLVAAQRGDFAEAIAHYHQALAADEGFVPARANLASVLAKSGDFEAAMVQFRRCLEILPDDPATLFSMAVAQAHHGSTDEAIATFRQVLQINPKFAVARMNLANLLAGRGDVERAIAELLRAIEIDPDDPAPYHRIAELFRSQGKLSEAAAYDERGRRAGRPAANGRAK